MSQNDQQSSITKDDYESQLTEDQLEFAKMLGRILAELWNQSEETPEKNEEN